MKSGGSFEPPEYALALNEPPEYALAPPLINSIPNCFQHLFEVHLAQTHNQTHQYRYKVKRKANKFTYPQKPLSKSFSKSFHKLINYQIL